MYICVITFDIKFHKKNVTFLNIFYHGNKGKY